MVVLKTTREAAHAAEATMLGAPLPDRDEISAYHLVDEAQLVGALIERAAWTDDARFPALLAAAAES